jgi:hypothetical protein
MGLFSQLKNSFGSDNKTSAETIQPQQSRLTMLDSGKIKAVVESLTKAEALFEQAGFQLEQLEIVLGAAPKVIPQFKQINTISAVIEKQLLEEIKHENLLLFIFTSLFKSVQMKNVMKNSHLTYFGMEIEITAEPYVKTIFKLKS